MSKAKKKRVAAKAKAPEDPAIVAATLREAEALPAEVRAVIEAEPTPPPLPPNADPVEKAQRTLLGMRLKALDVIIEAARKDAANGKTKMARELIEVSRRMLG